MQRVVVGVYGNALDLSADGRAALPKGVRALVEPELTYTQLIRQMGHRAYDGHGHRQPMRAERKVLYQYDGLGRLVTKAGFLDRLKRVLSESGYHPQVVDRTPPHPRPDRFAVDWDGVFEKFDLRARQDEALAMMAANDRGIVEAPTGFGKSFLFATVPVLFPNARVLVVCTRKDVVESIVGHMTKFIPGVGQIGGGRRHSARATVCTAQSLKHVDFNDTDVVLADEGHELAATTYSRELGRFNWARMYTFSASPFGRRDGTNIRLEALFGRVIFKMTYQEAVDLKLVVPIRVKWLSCHGPNPAMGLVDTARAREGLWRNEHRNRVFAQEAMSYAPDEQVLLMCTTFEHAAHMKRLLPGFTLCYAERGGEEDKKFKRFVKEGLLPADEPVMTDKRRQLLRSQFEAGKLKKVIATDVWSTGVNFHQLAVLLRLDGRRSAIMDTQLPGRVSRPHAPTGKECGYVIDSLDEFDENYHEAARWRYKNYVSKGWAQEMPEEHALMRGRW